MCTLMLSVDCIINPAADVLRRLYLHMADNEIDPQGADSFN